MKNNEENKGVLAFWFGVTIIIGLSIWLGFPSPNYNRTAISIVGYILGLLHCVSGILGVMDDGETDKK